MASFDDLPSGASPTDIYGKAGEIFKEQVNRDTQTDYTNPEAFNTAIWYIAEAAQRQNFTKLHDMSIDEIADEMGDYIAKYVRKRGSQR